MVTYESKESKSYAYWQLALGASFSLYNSFLYTYLIFISKGYSFTKDDFEPNEINKIALIMGSIYIIFSIYIIVLSLFNIAIALLICFIYYRILKNSKKVIATLTLRINMMQVNHLAGSLEASKTKLEMMQKYRILIHIFLTSQLFLIVAFLFTTIFKEDDDSFLLLLTLFEEVFEIIGVFGIFLLFWPKFRGLYFDLPEFENGNEIREVTPMYEASLSIRDSEGSAGKLVLIRQPLEVDNEEERIQNFMIAIPMNVVYRRNSSEGLQEPLLGRGLVNN